jgi:hypothetical protein
MQDPAPPAATGPTATSPATAPATTPTSEQAAALPPPPGSDQPPVPGTECPKDPCVRVPWQVLAVSLTWVIVLVASFICYERIDGFADFVSFKLGRLPFETIWLGAAGGWLISAQGIFRYNSEWRRSYDYWHYARPLLGALIGTLGCLVFIVLNDAASKESVAANAVFYDVIALAVGYREESFRTLIEKLFDTIILPGEKEEKKAAKAAAQPEASAPQVGAPTEPPPQPQ